MQTPISRRGKDAEPRDFGFGTSLDGRQSRLINRDGSLNVRRKGASWAAIHPYQTLVNMPGWKFALIVLGVYVGINSAFAVIYTFIGVNELAGMPETKMEFWEKFAEAFYFSAQTFTTVGYGRIAPEGHAASLVSSFQALLGLMMAAIATGVLYGRFSRPTARFRFSKSALIAPYKDQLNSFQFRLANERQNQLMDIEAQVMVTWHEPSGSGLRQVFFPLTLERDKVAMLPTTWTVVHPIDRDSPLWGKKERDLIKLEAEFLVILRAYDETFAQTILTRFSYRYDELVWGARFVKIFETGKSGAIELDLNRMDESTPAGLNVQGG